MKNRKWVTNMKGKEILIVPHPMGDVKLEFPRPTKVVVYTPPGVKVKKFSCEEK